VNLIPLSTLELWRELRGPGPRAQSDATATFVTHKVKPGDDKPSPTGLTLLWDRGGHAVYLVRPDSDKDPCIVVGWENVRRAIPESYDFILELSTSPEPRKGK
jgi:hypothetical protein